jgi:hypothetical protein
MKTNTSAGIRKRQRAKSNERVWVRHHPSLGEKYAWVVTWRDVEGKRRKKFYRTKSDADTFAEIKLTEVTNNGTQSESAYADERFRVMAWDAARKLRAVDSMLTPARVVDWFIDWRQRLEPFGRTVEEAVSYYAEHLRATARSVTIKGLIEQYRQSKSERASVRCTCATLTSAWNGSRRSSAMRWRMKSRQRRLKTGCTGWVSAGNPRTIFASIYTAFSTSDSNAIISPPIRF